MGTFCSSKKKTYKFESNNSPHTTISTNKPTLGSSILSIKKDSTEGTITSFYDIRSIYKIDSKVIGQGTFGTIRKAHRIRESSNKVFAVKTISKEKISNLHLLKRELEIIKKLDHPNIIKFYEVYQDSKYLHLVLEYAEGGELLERIIKNKYLQENEAAIIMKQILSSVNYLHKNNICHRDIKAENFMFSSLEKDSEIKLIDFGLSKIFSKTNEMETMVGSRYYIAPEVLQKKYDSQCDNWSAGVIMYILLCGNPPFTGNTNEEVFQNIMQGKYILKPNEFSKVSKSGIDLLNKLLEINPKKRLTAKKALEHKWIKKAEKPKIYNNLNYDEIIINLIKNFQNQSKLKKEALKVIINSLNEKEIVEVKNAFREIDKDNTGKISFRNLKLVINKLHTKNETFANLHGILQKMHIDENYEINYTEFIAATLNQIVNLSKEKLWTAFKHFDIDNTDYITENNLKEAMARAGRSVCEQDVKNMVDEVDVTKDGKICFDDFLKMMSNDNMDKNFKKEEADDNLKKN